ncbi:MFS transporter [Actinocrispum wychmicini]|uniref:Multidrug efflux pump Tap n=1 Tax=Actinocrispum wychmicini TaxID=1213861 RepID=A0A4R2JAG8_9PSEU|nr:MFS transporter [Actinocrispum wychmicini]TCO54852.1 MFS transporter [Actinocrispum wychmicini]
MATRSVRPLLTLFVANGLSLTGSAVSFVALPWFVLATTGSPASTGLVGFAGVTAMVLAGVVGGPVVDRLGHRTMSVVADLLSGVATAAIPAVYLLTGIPLWLVVALAAVRGFSDSLGGTARISLLPDLASAAGARLDRVNSGWSMVVRLSSVVGSPSAGVMIALVGPANALWIDAGSFLLSAALMASTPARGRVKAGVSLRSYLGELAGGFAYTVRDKLILAITLSLILVNFIEGPLFGVVLPVHVSRTYQSAVDLGLLFGANALGGLIGALLFAVLAPRLPRRPTFLLSFLALTLSIGGLSVAPTLLTAAIAFFCSGLVSGPINPLIFTTVHERVPDELRGRVIGIGRSLSFAASPLGTLVAGYALQSVSTQSALFAATGLFTIVTVIIWLNPAFRRMRQPLERNIAR